MAKTAPEMVEVEGESVEVVRTVPLSVVPSAPLADLVTHGQSDAGITEFEARVKNARRMLRAALQLTQPGQWMVYGEGDKRSAYATAGAADRILRQGFGMRWGPKRITVTDTEEALVVECRATLEQPDGKPYEEFLGTRRGAYKDGKTIKGYLKDEQNLIKGSIANMKHRAVTAIMGLTFLTPHDCKALGLDLDQLQRKVEFQDNTKEAATEVGALVVPFGRCKGQKPSELAEKELNWHLDAAKKSVEDPAKAKWREKNQAWLDALDAENERRLAPKEPAPATEPAPSAFVDPGELPDWNDR